MVDFYGKCRQIYQSHGCYGLDGIRSPNEKRQIVVEIKRKRPIGGCGQNPSVRYREVLWPQLLSTSPFSSTSTNQPFWFRDNSQWFTTPLVKLVHIKIRVQKRGRKIWITDHVLVWLWQNVCDFTERCMVGLNFLSGKRIRTKPELVLWKERIDSYWWITNTT